MSPVFSVIMTSFNYAPYIGAAIESVLMQSFLDWELIVIDDCSTDNSWEIIQKFEDERIKAYRQSTNSGACAAYNRGLRTAKGQYIASLDSDDIFLPNKLERQFQFLLKHPEVDVCGSYIAEINKEGKLHTSNEGYSTWFNIKKELNNPENWLWENHLCHSSVVIRSESHKRIGEFQINLKYTPDWQFWIRALINNCCFSVIDEPLIKYRNHDYNITHQSPVDVVWEHAGTSVTYLLPWLKNLGRKDLVEKLIYGFINNPTFLDSKNIQIDLLKNNRSNSARIELSIAALQILISQTEDLKLGNEWLASQSAAWERAASQKDDRIAKLEADLSESKVALERILGHAGVRFINLFTKKKLF